MLFVRPVAAARGSECAALLSLHFHVAFVQYHLVPNVYSAGHGGESMPKSIIVFALLLLTFGAANWQGAPATQEISSLSWLAGSWSGVRDGLEMEELWMMPKGNTMLGLHRDVKGERTVLFEFLRIEAKPDGITYWASPKGRPATPFKLAEARENYVAFENPDHDFPKRIIYWIADCALHAKIEGTMNGKAASEEWVWKKN